jgi:hypothetical protein
MAQTFSEWRRENSGTRADYESYLAGLAETARAANGPGYETGDVRIRWSETRWYTAVVPRRHLAEAVAAKGPENDGHELPAHLSGLNGDPFDHGDLNGLLCDLEPGSLTEVDGIEVGSVEEVPPS